MKLGQFFFSANPIYIDFLLEWKKLVQMALSSKSSEISYFSLFFYLFICSYSNNLIAGHPIN